MAKCRIVLNINKLTQVMSTIPVVATHICVLSMKREVSVAYMYSDNRLPIEL